MRQSSLKNLFDYEGLTKYLNWSKVSFIIWDLDGTLSPESPVTEKITTEAFTMVFREFLEDQGVLLDPEDLIALTNDDEAGKKFEDRALVRAMSDYVDVSQFLTPDYHSRLHDAMISLAQMHGLPEYCDQTYNALRHLAPIRKQYILTHSSKQWTDFVIEQMQLPGFEDDHHIYDYERVGYKSKAAGPDPFLQVCEEHNLNPEFGLFVDNSPDNLVAAARIGLQTILVLGDNDPVRSTLSFINGQVRSAAEIGHQYRVHAALQPEHQPDKSEINKRERTSVRDGLFGIACAATTRPS